MNQLKFSKIYRKQLSEKLMDLGNLTLVALVFGQLVSGQAISLLALILGLVVYVLCYTISYLISL